MHPRARPVLVEERFPPRTMDSLETATGSLDERSTPRLSAYGLSELLRMRFLGELGEQRDER